MALPGTVDSLSDDQPRLGAIVLGPSERELRPAHGADQLCAVERAPCDESLIFVLIDGKSVRLAARRTAVARAVEEAVAAPVADEHRGSVFSRLVFMTISHLWGLKGSS
jgi:hypothetical protein